MNFTFVDFCAGIGGGRVGLEAVGGECLGFSEIDKNAEATYRLFFGDKEKNFGDLTQIAPATLPDFDLMIAGFPCQAFSVLGKRQGIHDKRGQIFYYLSDILQQKKVKYFILENVKGLVNHDNKRTLRIILDNLNQAGYTVKWQILNSLDYGVPQSRERIYFVGIRHDMPGGLAEYQFPPPSAAKIDLQNFLIEPQDLIFDEKHEQYKTFLNYLNNKYNKGKFDIQQLLKENYLIIDTRQSDLRLYRDKVPTLRLGRHGLLYVKAGKLHRLSGYESLLLQGFPHHLAIQTKHKISEANVLKQTGNAMTVPTIQAIAHSLIEHINQPEQSSFYLVSQSVSYG